MPKCACGKTLEEGFMGCLWCPTCGNDWKIPEDGKENQEYYMNITLMDEDETAEIRSKFQPKEASK